MPTPSPLMFASKRQLADVGIHSPNKNAVERVKNTPLYSTDSNGNVSNTDFLDTENVAELSLSELKYWWSCLRKHSFVNKEAAEKVITQHDSQDTMDAYSCTYCRLWHNGRKASSKNLSPSSLKGYWTKKRKDKPTVEQVQVAYQNPRKEADRYWKGREYLQQYR